MATDDPSNAPGDSTGKRPRRWLRALVIVGLVVVAAGIWLAGPGKRVIGSHVLRNQLEKAGLSGDFRIEDIGPNGVTLRDVNLEGLGLVRSIRGDSLKVEFRVNELRDGRIRAFDATNLTIALDLEAAPERAEDPTIPFDANALGETLRAVQGKLGPIALDAKNMTLNITRGNQPVAIIEGADLHHVPGTDRFTLKFRNIIQTEKLAPEDEPPPPDQGSVDGAAPLAMFVQDVGKSTELVPGQEVEIIWSAAGLLIDRLEILPGIVLENLKLDHAAGQPLATETLIAIDGAQVRVRLGDDLRNARFTLERGPLDLASLARRFDADTVLAGSLAAMEVSIEDIFATRGNWRVRATASGPVVRFREWSLDEVALTLAKDPGNAALDLRAGIFGTRFTLTSKAEFPADRVIDPVRWWHDAVITGTVVTENLQPAVAEFRSRLTPDPPTLPIPRANLAADFTATLQANQLAKIAAAYQLSELAIDGRSLTPVAGELTWNVPGNQLDATARHPAGADPAGLAVSIGWDFQTNGYRASATARGYDLGPLADFLVPFGVTLPAGTLNGTWQGDGLLGAERRHRGTLALGESTLAFPNRPPLSGDIQASYAWPGNIEIARLQVTQGDHTLAGQASWKDGILTVNEMLLNAGPAVLLSGAAVVPLDPKVRTLADFLAQPGAVTANLKADALTLAQLRDLVPGFEFPGTGAIFGSLAVSGTFADPAAQALVEVRGLAATGLEAVAPMDVTANLDYAAGRLALESRIVQQDATIFNLDASIPLSPAVRSLKDLVAQPGEISFNLQSARLAIGQVRPLVPTARLPDAGNLTSNIAISGTFGKPAITATLDATGLTGGPLGNTLPPTDLAVTLTSADSRLIVTGTARQPNAPPATLSGSIGFRPQRWLDNPQLIAEETIDLGVQIQGLNGRQFVQKVPGVADFSVLIDANLSATGRLNDPDLRGTITARQGQLRPQNDSLPTLSNLQMTLRFDRRKATLDNLRMTHAGGTVTLRGSADFAVLNNPVLDLTLTGDQALLWRDDSMNARANAALRLTGPFDAAELSGSLAMVETLYYRDLEIIPTSPFRGPRKPAVVAQVDELVKPDEVAERWNIPAPFNNWTLDLGITTRDPVLLRGDRVGGSIAANIRARGTLGNPQLDGAAVLNNAKLRLPFSTLQIASGTATFTPERGFDPLLSLRGTSRISPYDVTVFVSGTASNPDLLFTADPPLPESEILSLLATGSTTRDLGVETLTVKAIQLFIEELRRSRLPFGRQLGQLVDILDEVEIRVGADDPYTGRRLTSASVALTDRVLISVAIDEDGNTRALVMYLFRFR